GTAFAASRELKKSGLFPLRRSARQLAVKCGDSTKALRRVRHSWYQWQCRNRKFRNVLKRFRECFAFACWHANLLKLREKRGQVIIPCFCRIEKRLRKSMPLVERHHQLVNAQFPTNSLLHCS